MSTHDKVNILMVDDHPAKLLSYEAILEELDENSRLTKEDKDAVRYRNAERFYGLPEN